MNNRKSLFVSMGFALMLLSCSKSANAHKALNHDHLNAIPVGQSSAATVTSIKSGIQIRRGTGFQGETVGGVNILIPQDVFEAINISENTGTTSTEVATSSEQIVICLTDACAPANGSDSNTISVNDLAHLVESDLNQALSDLVAAEQAAANGAVATDDSRQIVRRESDANCGCVPGESNIVRKLSNPNNSNISHNVKTVTEARQIVETKLEESRIFVEQINQLKPENSLW